MYYCYVWIIPYVKIRDIMRLLEIATGDDSGCEIEVDWLIR